jgi:hypothetical protein
MPETVCEVRRGAMPVSQLVECASASLCVVPVCPILPPRTEKRAGREASMDAP